jgi:hypothetical protein
MTTRLLVSLAIPSIPWDDVNFRHAYHGLSRDNVRLVLTCVCRPTPINRSRGTGNLEFF